ncbi:aspartyl-phosphate phosphatase Spo0E family protein [Tepidibacter thalassicus]|uniref:Spo0E like sporulation regulatory protein n=1 Tax=Tepidibacter thalassicus DSM 15285 TaxID=1123350 RepID=A0A1M5PNH7_9FIRM|nr:aspartyl-phosphate phosphatase Spo0E family protein [Tepidibacter thalassicus]SHH03248.1 Spo0E like sporulation regulatory protein [Tepidibacter thalassicus DSM 15285]
MQKIRTLQANIEVLREKLNKLIEDKDFKLSNREIISLSQELDVLLDDYVKFKNSKFIF